VVEVFPRSAREADNLVEVPLIVDHCAKQNIARSKRERGTIEPFVERRLLAIELHPDRERVISAPERVLFVFGHVRQERPPRDRQVAFAATYRHVHAAERHVGEVRETCAIHEHGQTSLGGMGSGVLHVELDRQGVALARWCPGRAGNGGRQRIEPNPFAGRILGRRGVAARILLGRHGAAARAVRRCGAAARVFGGSGSGIRLVLVIGLPGVTFVRRRAITRIGT
jgi:hypothetical protein